jgi:hypothetical protein
MIMNDYVAHKLHDERADRLGAEAARFRLARPAVRRLRGRSSRPWWHRLALGGHPAILRPA